MVSNSATLDCRTKQHTESGVSTSDGSRDMARTRSWRKKKKKKEKKRKRKKKMNSWNSIKHPLRGSLNIDDRVGSSVTLIEFSMKRRISQNVNHGEA